MPEWIVVAEANADKKIATDLIERLLNEKVQWLEAEAICYHFRWSGICRETEGYTKWAGGVRQAISISKTNGIKMPKLRRNGNETLGFDGASTKKILLLLNLLNNSGRDIKAVILVRDIDNQKQRKKSIQSVCESDNSGIVKVLGCADPKREAWVLNGYIPKSSEEKEQFAQLKKELGFDPCLYPQKLNGKSGELRDSKRVLSQLTANSFDRERECWTESCLDQLRKNGTETGLKDFLQSAENLLPLITGHSQEN